MIEIEAGGKRKSEAYYANRLSTEVTEEYGRIRVLDKITGNPLPKVYVKTYARMNNGQVRFYKDGYTDLRGKFEYASLNTDDLDQVQRFALLVIDPDAGAQIEEAPRPLDKSPCHCEEGAQATGAAIHRVSGNADDLSLRSLAHSGSPRAYPSC